VGLLHLKASTCISQKFFTSHHKGPGRQKIAPSCPSMIHGNDPPIFIYSQIESDEDDCAVFDDDENDVFHLDCDAKLGRFRNRSQLSGKHQTKNRRSGN